MLSDFEIGKVYNFDTRSSSILGASVLNAKLKSILDYNSALEIEDIKARHRVIYPTLPAGTVDDIEGSVFYLFENETSSNLLFANTWINASTITLIEYVNYTIKVMDASSGDGDKISQTLNSLGFLNVSVKIDV